MKKAIVTILTLALVFGAGFSAAINILHAAALDEYTAAHYSTGEYRDCPPEK